MKRARISGAAVHLIRVIGEDDTVQNLRIVTSNPY